MKKLTFSLCALAALSGAAFAGTSTYSSGKEMQQTAAAVQTTDFYATNEFNIDLWGTYAFTGNNWRDDRYLGVDHAWGGGLDAKYFFMRYFGVGLEGYGVALNSYRGTFFDINGSRQNSGGAAGSALGTFTFRYPIPGTRFAPYVYAGGGAVFGGGGTEVVGFINGDKADSKALTVFTNNRGSQTKAVGQFGGGLEVRITPHIGIMNDFCWNVVDGPYNDYGMVRSGITFAF